MPNLVLDSSGRPAPQYLSEDGSAFAYSTGKNGAMNVTLLGADTKAPGDALQGKVLPTQLFGGDGKVVQFFNEEKLQRTIFAVSTYSGVNTSLPFSITSACTLTLYIVSTSELSGISEITLEGDFMGKYYPIQTVTAPVNSCPTCICIPFVSTGVLPTSVRFKITSDPSTPYGAFMVAK